MSVRRLAAIVVFDVVGYSRMMAEDEDGTHSALKAHRIELDPILLNHGGRIVKGTGDGLLLEVPSAVEAVKASIEAQRLMTERNAVLPEGRRMQFRVGINLGDIIAEDDGDIYGDGVNVAARLEGLANPGGICVSGSIHDQVVGRVDCSFTDLGRVDVKNIPQPVHGFHVVKDNEEPVKTEATSSYATPSVAVFPFSNLSHDPEQDYFADGITEDLITALSHYQDIRVSSRSSVFSIGGRNLDIRDAARELDATYVVHGSVRKAGKRVRITAQLVEAETGHHVWADKFDRELDDIFQVQDEIVFEIAGHLHPSLERREVGKLEAASPEELDVWDLMLRARKENFRGTIEGSREAIRLLEIARERDPTSATTHAYLAGAWTSVPSIGGRSTTANRSWSFFAPQQRHPV